MDKESTESRRMRVAFFYPDSMFSAWSLSEGAVGALRRMGHEVLACPIPQVQTIGRKEFDAARQRMPSVRDLNLLDGIIVSGVEHLTPWLDVLYKDQWTRLRVPRAAWVHESNDRDDRHFGFENIRRLADHWFYPAIQDAEQLGGEWLPFGFDPAVFRPSVEYVPAPLAEKNGRIVLPGCAGAADGGVPCISIDPSGKRFDAAFIGLMYEKRQQFFARLTPLLGDIEFKCGNVQIIDLSGVHMKETMELYAENIRQIRVFVNLPTLSRLLVTKVFEVVACGTFLVTSKPQGDPRNAHLENIAYCETPEQLAEIIKMMLRDEAGREALARAACEDAHRNHSVETRLKAILGKFKTQS